jgi:hypothetical protein
MEHINTLCGQNAELLNIEAGGIYSNHLKGSSRVSVCAMVSLFVLSIHQMLPCVVR